MSQFKKLSREKLYKDRSKEVGKTGVFLPTTTKKGKAEYCIRYLIVYFRIFA